MFFFHTSIGGMKHITTCYAVDCVLNTAGVIEDRNIFAKYKNPHISEFLAGERTDKDDDFVIFGDPITSRMLKKCLIFDKTHAEKLTLNIKFSKGKTEMQTFCSATRAWRKLTDSGVKVFWKKISHLKKKEEVLIQSHLPTRQQRLLRKMLKNLSRRIQVLLEKI